MHWFLGGLRNVSSGNFGDRMVISDRFLREWAIEATSEMGGAQRRGFPARNSAVEGCLLAALRHPGEARAAPPARNAADQEYAIVFPEYYFGQIFEAKHEPGTVAYSMDLQLRLLQETTDEMSRNGCKKVIIVNGHGGNEHLLPYFGQAQLDKPHDYVVYVLDGERSKAGGPAKKSTGIDYHAGENESSNLLYSHPELAHIDRAGSESGADEKRQKLPEGLYTGIWWYARFPNHYSGDGSVATKELGEWNMNNWIGAIAESIRSVKADDVSLKLQNEFYEKSRHPLDTRP
jgi:creatinine amidohydrolase